MCDIWELRPYDHEHVSSSVPSPPAAKQRKLQSQFHKWTLETAEQQLGKNLGLIRGELRKKLFSTFQVSFSWSSNAIYTRQLNKRK